VPLRQIQLDALPILEWLLDPTVRANGRSVAIAVATIRVACRNPGTRVLILDHAPGLGALQNMIALIRGMVRADPRLARYVTFPTTTSLTVDLTVPIRDWLPTEGWLGHEPSPSLEERARQRQMEMMVREDLGDEELTLAVERSQLGMSENYFEAGLQAARRLIQTGPVPQPGIHEPGILLSELEAPHRPHLKSKKGTSKPKVEPPQPRSSWDRILDDED
jgi:hypothetical protein